MDPTEKRERLRQAEELTNNRLLTAALQEMEGRSVNELLTCQPEERDRWIGTIIATRQFKNQLKVILLEGINDE